MLIIHTRSFCWTNKEQLEEARASAAEAKKSSASISERIQGLQAELSQSERRREELETELKNTQEVSRFFLVATHLEPDYCYGNATESKLCWPPAQFKRRGFFFRCVQLLQQRSACLTEAQRSAQSAQVERATVEERLRGLQRAVALLETEKKDAERQAVRLEKDKNALRNTLDKVRIILYAWMLLLTVVQLRKHETTGFVSPPWCVSDTLTSASLARLSGRS